MSWIVGDGFDYYGLLADLARSVWDSVTTAGTFTTGRFGTGQSWSSTGTGLQLIKNFPANESTVFLVFAWYRPGALSGTTAEAAFILRDAGTAQCSVVMESSGNIVLKSGIQTGTVLATYTAAFPQDVWCHFQVKVVISNTAGSMTVRKNGQTSDTYASATNLNTRGGTANNYANCMLVGTFTASADRLDDVLVYSATAPAPNDWVGDTRAILLPPNADTAQKQMVFTPTDTQTFGTGGAAGAMTLVTGTVWFTSTNAPTRGGSISKITYPSLSAVTGHFKMAVYLNDGTGGLPGTLLGVSAEVTNIPASNTDFTFATPIPVSPVRGYYFAIMTDAASISLRSTVSIGINCYSATGFPYAGGFPSTAPATPTNQGTTGVGATATFSGNCSTVSELLANGDTDYVSSANVNDMDLYDLESVWVNPLTIIGVVSKLYVKKSDAGARSGQLVLKSGATTVTGTDTVLASTYTYLSRVDTTDPNTGVAWTVSGLNALQLGQKVTA